VAAAAEFHQPRRRLHREHRARHFRREHRGALAAQQQHGAGDTVPRVPEEEPEAGRERPQQPHDARVVVQAPARAVAPRAVPREVAPLLGGELAPVAVAPAHVRFDLPGRIEMGGHLYVVRDRLQRVERHEGADVVHREARHRSHGARREQHPEETSHRGPDPLDAPRADVREERLRVGEELAEVVLQRRGEPVALAAAGEVDAHDAGIAAQRAREEIEVARVAAIAVRADDDLGVGALAPLDVMQPVEAPRAEGGEGVMPWPDARVCARRTRFESALEGLAPRRGRHAALQ